MNAYAVISTGGKQYKVSLGDLVNVELVPGDAGATVELDRVLALSHDGELEVGEPTVAGARVVAEVEGRGRDKKIIVFKFKAKTRYHRKKGHRQNFTSLRVKEIVLPSGERLGFVPVEPPPEEAPPPPEEVAPTRRRRSRRVPPAEPEAQAEVVAEAKPTPRRRSRTPKPRASGEAGQGSGAASTSGDDQEERTDSSAGAVT